MASWWIGRGWNRSCAVHCCRHGPHGHPDLPHCGRHPSGPVYDRRRQVAADWSRECRKLATPFVRCRSRSSAGMATSTLRRCRSLSCRRRPRGDALSNVTLPDVMAEGLPPDYVVGLRSALWAARVSATPSPVVPMRLLLHRCPGQPGGRVRASTCSSIWTTLDVQVTAFSADGTSLSKDFQIFLGLSERYIAGSGQDRGHGRPGRGLPAGSA